jgi:hypothetical protein
VIADRWFLVGRVEKTGKVDQHVHMTTKKPVSPEVQNILERAAKELSEAMLKEGVAFEEVARIDERILDMVRKIGRQTTEEVIKKKAQEAVEIQKKAGVKTHRKSIIECENIFGKIEINSPYLWMKNCGSSRPVHEFLGLSDGTRSQAVRRALTDFGAEESFAHASTRFHEHYGWEIGRTSILRIVENEARRAEKFVKEKLAQEHELYVSGCVQKSGLSEVLVQLDGCEVRTGKLKRNPGGGVSEKRKSPSRIRVTEWRDVRDGLARNMTGESGLCVSGLKSFPDIVKDVLSIASLVGMTDKTTVVGVTDGGNGLSEEMRVQLPNFVHILDKPHLAHHLNEAAETAGKSDAQRECWVREKLVQCDEGHACEVITECKSHKGRGKKRATQLAGYLTKFEKSTNYGEFERLGYPIGSGECESLHRTLTQKRMKLPGAWWDVKNINPMLALRVVRANGWWNEFWNLDQTPPLNCDQPISLDDF